ncbi:MAG TPA: hypothetical protein HA282_01485 [Nanoarchaeota archaeon]|nr:hypothetical protein [Candidatus Pacearchaeota archaeon]HIH17339.1 hypothetical protein [Nanoarchaeota archaeon]HIH34785.1 hypothetical protein [Nanoarchaeota archaeon]HIH51217.1 hypothetical protein [Nanoarchaeota archaeon]HIH65871.1 hypothetical protein [Nanoarchaeota archaeon]
MGFKLRRTEEKDFDCEDWAYYYNDRIIFGASRFPLMKNPVPEIMVDGVTGKQNALHRPYAALWWPSADKPAMHAVDKFVEFYRLIEGDVGYSALNDVGKAYKGIFVLNGQGKREDVSVSPHDAVSALEGELASENFSLIRIGTPYADFGLEALPKNSENDLGLAERDYTWKNGERRIGIVTHNNISDPLADLILRTGRVQILKGDLQPVLRELLTF